MATTTVMITMAIMTMTKMINDRYIRKHHPYKKKELMFRIYEQIMYNNKYLPLMAS